MGKKRSLFLVSIAVGLSVGACATHTPLASSAGSAGSGGAAGSTNTNTNTTATLSQYYPQQVATAAQVDAACTAAEACSTGGGAVCHTNFDGIVMPLECAQAIETADCTNQSLAIPADKCFPVCSSTEHHCNGDDTITSCTDKLLSNASLGLRAITLRCTTVCASNSTTYSGTCASTYQGKKSSTGNDVCWCN